MHQNFTDFMYYFSKHMAATTIIVSNLLKFLTKAENKEISLVDSVLLALKQSSPWCDGKITEFSAAGPQRVPVSQVLAVSEQEQELCYRLY